MPSPLLTALIAHFDSVFYGPNGDYPSVLESLAGIPADQAARHPAPGCNSIWQITDHLTASNHWQVGMLEKGEADLPVWTEPPGGEDAWQASLDLLRESHTRLKTALSKVPDESLMIMPLLDWNLTQLELLLSMAAHEACHAGQIDYLKGLLSP